MHDGRRTSYLRIAVQKYRKFVDSRIVLYLYTYTFLNNTFYYIIMHALVQWHLSLNIDFRVLI